MVIFNFSNKNIKIVQACFLGNVYWRYSFLIDKFPAKNYIMSQYDYISYIVPGIWGYEYPKKKCHETSPLGSSQKGELTRPLASVYKAGVRERTLCSSWKVCTRIALLQGETCKWTWLHSSGSSKRFALTGFSACRTMSSPASSVPSNSIGWHINISDHKVMLFLRTKVHPHPVCVRHYSCP